MDKNKWMGKWGSTEVSRQIVLAARLMPVERKSVHLRALCSKYDSKKQELSFVLWYNETIVQ